MNATIDSLKPPILYNELPWLDQKSLASNSKVQTADKLIESLVVGWKASNAIFWPSAIISNMFGAAHSLLGIIGTSACLGGIAFATKNFMQQPSLDHNESSTIKIKTIAKSAFQGITDGIAIFGTVAAAILLIDQRNCRYHQSCDLQQSLFLASIIIAGVGQTIYSYLCRAEQEKIQAQPITKLSKLTNLVKSIGEGALTVGAIIGSLVATHLAINNSAHTIDTILISSSLITAMASSIERYNSNSSTSPASEKTLRKKFTQSFTTGWKAYGGAMLIGAIANDIFRFPINESLYLMGAAGFGIGYGIGTFHKKTIANDVTVIGTTDQETILPPSPSLASRTFQIIRTGLSNVYQKWKVTSKLKKSGIILVSLAALTALGILYIGPENVYTTGKEKYNQYAFTNTTETTTKTLGEWIKGYSDFDEMTRLASLTENNEYRNFDEVPCAEILQTCHLNKDATTDHKKVYREKALKFHPDKYKNSDDLKQLAEKAMTALSRAQEMIKNQKECAGQEEDSCLANETEQTITRILKQPHWFFEKVMGEVSTCFFQIDDQEPIQTSLDFCKGLSS